MKWLPWQKNSYDLMKALNMIKALNMTELVADYDEFFSASETLFFKRCLLAWLVLVLSVSFSTSALSAEKQR
jgi:spore coat polysaccharide biosynthesis predicted glycosyltransferase SpsG